jgi:hypothetical protein
LQNASTLKSGDQQLKMMNSKSLRGLLKNFFTHRVWEKTLPKPVASIRSVGENPALQTLFASTIWTIIPDSRHSSLCLQVSRLRRATPNHRTVFPAAEPFANFINVFHVSFRQLPSHLQNHPARQNRRQKLACLMLHFILGPGRRNQPEAKPGK